MTNEESRSFDPGWYMACLALLFLTGHSPRRDDEAAYWHGAYDALWRMIGGDENDPA